MAVVPTNPLNVGSGSPTRIDVTTESDANNTGAATWEANYGQDIWLTVGGTDIFIGGSNVTASGANKGKLAKAGTDVTLTLKGTGGIYAITASGTSACDVLQVGV